MALLHQIPALEMGSKDGAELGLSRACQRLRKSELLHVLEKTDRPTDQEGDQLPLGSKRRQVHAPDVGAEVKRNLSGS